MLVANGERRRDLAATDMCSKRPPGQQRVLMATRTQHLYIEYTCIVAGPETSARGEHCTKYAATAAHMILIAARAEEQAPDFGSGLPTGTVATCQGEQPSASLCLRWPRVDAWAGRRRSSCPTWPMLCRLSGRIPEGAFVRWKLQLLSIALQKG